MRKVVFLAILLLFSCETKFQKSLKKAQKFAKTGVYREFDDIMKERTQKIKKMMPEFIHEKVSDSDKQAIVDFRIKVANLDTIEDIESLLARLGNKNPDAEKKLKEVKTFLKYMRDYYNRKIQLKSYLKYLDEYLKYNPKGIMRDEAYAEELFIHFIHLYDLDKYDEDTKLTSFFRFWKLAFDFPSEKREAFMDYITRLCDKKLKSYCKNIMYEDRPKALLKPYLEALVKKIDEFLKIHGNSIYKPLFLKVKADLLERLKNIPKFEEYPVLPDTYSNLSCVGGLKLVAGKKGIYFDNVQYLPYKEGFKYKKGEWKGFLNKLEEKLNELLDMQQGEDPYISLITLELEKDFPMPLLFDILTYFRQNRVNNVALCGRKRIDGSNQKMMHLLTLFPEKNPRLKEVIIDADKKKVEKLEKEPIDQEIFYKKLPKKIFGKEPDYYFFLGKLPLDIKPPRIAVMFDKARKKWLYATLKNNKIEKREYLDKVDFERTKNEISLLLIKKRGLSLQKLFNFLDPFMYKCKTKKCDEVERSESAKGVGFY